MRSFASSFKYSSYCTFKLCFEDLKLNVCGVIGRPKEPMSSKAGFEIPNKDEEDYFLLLKTADSAIQQFNELPEFVDPLLVPSPGSRTSFKPKENPLGT